jgi:hypothetical protein
MFCPACGFEERAARQFCRKCGGDLRPVLAALQNPESASGSGRDEVYRALAARIKDGKAKDVKELVEKVLPKIERLFESPEQKRVREVRTGVTLACAGLGLALFFFLRHFAGFYGTKEENFLLPAALIAILSGLGYVLSAWLFPVPEGRAPGFLPGRGTNELQGLVGGQQSGSESTAQPSSITENTTRELEVTGAASRTDSSTR